jgi:hypothetical protein
MDTMYIGSGDVTALLSGLNTETHYNLLRRFVSGVKPYYNAKNSPIDALRTGAILEDRYYLCLDDSWFSQYRVQSEDMDVFKASLDFARLDAGVVCEFEEVKTVELDDYMNIKAMDEAERLKTVKKKYKHYYNQVQEQLYCTGLPFATMVFVAVLSYDDDVNYNRIIEPHEIMKVRIDRDDGVVNLIKERGKPFQMLKDYYTK